MMQTYKLRPPKTGSLRKKTVKDALFQHFGKGFRQADVVYSRCIGEQWCNILITETGNSTTNARDEKEELGMFLGKDNEVIHIGFDGFYTALHGRDGVALATKAHSTTHHGTELLPGSMSCSPMQ